MVVVFAGLPRPTRQDARLGRHGARHGRHVRTHTGAVTAHAAAITSGRTLGPSRRTPRPSRQDAHWGRHGAHRGHHVRTHAAAVTSGRTLGPSRRMPRLSHRTHTRAVTLHTAAVTAHTREARRGRCPGAPCCVPCSSASRVHTEQTFLTNYFPFLFLVIMKTLYGLKKT